MANASEQAAIANLVEPETCSWSPSRRKIGRRGRTAGGRVALADLVVFTRQLATMIDAGLAMVQCLQGLADQTTNKIMRDVIHDVCTRVEGGDSFSMALTKHPKVFTRLYVSMVDAGEKGGLLAEVLARLATYLENTARLRKKVKSAMMYPTAVTVIAIAITTSSSSGWSRLWRDLRGIRRGLPGPTQFMINSATCSATTSSSSHPRSPWPSTAGSPTSRPSPAASSGIAPHPHAHLRIHRPQDLPRPVLAHPGLPGPQRRSHPRGAQHRRQHQRQRRDGKAIRTAAGDIERGEGISNALGKHAIFPSMIIRMMTAGEQTGKLDAMLERVADFLDEEIETTLSGPDLADRTFADRLPRHRGRRHRDLHVPAHLQDEPDHQ
jgi:type IV pilus assembly protein PilC